jgi:bis(5'-nucleosyl)-tetraphosphatase (symmetrical)
MAIYAIGDIQGRLAELHHLLAEVQFDPGKDQLWVVGDMVNRGPDSLGVLRFIKSLGHAAKAVLGNHDLRLLALAAGVTPAREKDTLSEVLQAPDCDMLISWLRHLPFVHVDKELKTLMVHAGIHPEWNEKQTITFGRQAEAALQGENFANFLTDIHSRKVAVWDDLSPAADRTNCIVNTLTRTRFCTREGILDFTYKGPPGSQPNDFLPWFRHPKRRCSKWRIVFGHWSTLGYLRETNILGLDSGCHWGKLLTIARLDCKKEKIWQHKCTPD